MHFAVDNESCVRSEGVRPLACDAHKTRQPFMTIAVHAVSTEVVWGVDLQGEVRSMRHTPTAVLYRKDDPNSQDAACMAGRQQFMKQRQFGPLAPSEHVRDVKML